MAVIELHETPLTRPSCPQPKRVLHLLDGENLLGGPDVSLAAARQACAAYGAVAPHGDNEQYVVASSHRAARNQWFAWPACARRLVRSGPDGADLELLRVINEEDIAARYDHVVIGSGDGIFAFPAARLQSAGCTVTVVSRGDSLSRELRLAVRDTRLLDDPAVAYAVGGAR